MLIYRQPPYMILSLFLALVSASALNHAFVANWSSTYSEYTSLADFPESMAATFFPFSYATPKEVSGTQGQYFYFKLGFCGGQQSYDGLIATVLITLESYKWNVDNDAFLAVQVAADAAQSKIITNNTVKGVIQQTFSFPYSASQASDLYFQIEVPMGVPVTMVFTMKVTFSKPTGLAAGEKVAPLPLTLRPASPGLSADPTYTSLKQFYYNSAAIQTVEAASNTLSLFDVCPGSSSYTVSIEAYCVNDGVYGCGLDLFVCTDPSQFDCSPKKTNIYDNSGTSLASVTISASNSNFAQIQVVVQNAGAYAQSSQYILTVNVQSTS